MRLTASASPADDPARVRVRFTVRDTGPGLSQAAQARVFEEFEQGEAGVAAGGAGLGLAIARRLADAMAGRLGVESREGQGAAFWLEAEFLRADAADPARDPLGGALAGRTVGVASPSAVVREAAAAQVEACGGRAVVAAEVAALADRALDAPAGRSGLSRRAGRRRRACAPSCCWPPEARDPDRPPPAPRATPAT